jgi:hypothetical protein
MKQWSIVRYYMLLMSAKAFIFFCLVILFSCSHKQGNQNKEDKLLLIAKIDSIKNQEGAATVFVATQLKNFSKDTIKYVSMSCSWEDAYATDAEQLSVIWKECDKNFPLVITIPPSQSQERRLQLIGKEQLDKLKDLSFRIGLNLVLAPDSNKLFPKLSQLSNHLNDMKNVIWSNTLIIR